MKAACIILSIIIFVAIMAVCVMVKFATDITVEERKREFQLEGGVYQVTKSIAVIALNENTTKPIADRFPYVVAVARNSSKTWSFACFGTVVLVKWIVTSAHCRKPGATHRVLLLYDFAKNVTRTYPILLWRIHEKFNISNPTPKYDIAVAKLNVDSYLFSLKSATFDENPGKGIEASIWKTVATMDRKVFLTNDFDNFNLKIAPEGKCFESYGIRLDPSLICVDLSDHEDCFVHEFGPIFSGDKIVGILAVKPRECDIKLAIFTNVSYYANWILKLTQTTYYGYLKGVAAGTHWINEVTNLALKISNTRVIDYEQIDSLKGVAARRIHEATSSALKSSIIVPHVKQDNASVWLKGVAAAHRIHEATILALKSSNINVTDFERNDRSVYSLLWLS